MPISCQLVKIDGEWPTRRPTVREVLSRCALVARNWRLSVRDVHGVMEFVTRPVTLEVARDDPRVTEILEFDDNPYTTPRVLYRRPD